MRKLLLGAGGARGARGRVRARGRHDRAAADPGTTQPAPVDAATCAADATFVTTARSPSAPDNPAFPPWCEGGTTDEHREWEFNDPYQLGKGFEGAVAYAVAEQLGFTPDQVEWVPVPFNKSFAPGPKDFDFDINRSRTRPSARRPSTSARATTT